jgi:hypothetical protein
MRFGGIALGTVVVLGAALAACSGSDGSLKKGFDPSQPNGGNVGDNDAGGTPGPTSTGAGTGTGTGNPNPNPTGGHDAGTPPPGQDAGGPPPPVDAGVDAPPNDGFDQFQHRNLDDINGYRATQNLTPLVLDRQLSDFASAGSQELSQDHLPHQHFIDASNNGTLWTSGFNGNAEENQGDPNGWYVMSQDPVQNELMQIDDIQQQMFNEGPGTGDAHGHYMNIMDPNNRRVGVGLLEVNGQLYLTNDFSP